MSDKTVTIIDYGSGNLLSVSRALERAGATVKLSDDPDEIYSAERLLLPGVGAFQDGMEGLRKRDLIEPIRLYAATGRPLLGICLGMQMLASVSEEFGEHEGLGLIAGRVKPVPKYDIDGLKLKIPHIGWADLIKPELVDWKNTMFFEIPENTSVYMVHSFHFVPTNANHRLVDCLFGGHRIVAVVNNGRTVGCQFHPEKSGEVGIKLLRAFIDL